MSDRTHAAAVFISVELEAASKAPSSHGNAADAITTGLIMESLLVQGSIAQA